MPYIIDPLADFLSGWLKISAASILLGLLTGVALGVFVVVMDAVFPDIFPDGRLFSGTVFILTFIGGIFGIVGGAVRSFDDVFVE